MLQLQRAWPPRPLTRGSAPGPRWGLCPQTPVIGRKVALLRSPRGRPPRYCGLEPPLHMTMDKQKAQLRARIADSTCCQWPSKSSKVDDFHFIRKGVRHFLLVINSNLGVSLTFPRYGQFSVYRWKTHIFPIPRPFNPEFENVLLVLNHWNFTCLDLCHRANQSCKKTSPTTYCSATINPLQTTDRR